MIVVIIVIIIIIIIFPSRPPCGLASRLSAASSSGAAPILAQRLEAQSRSSWKSRRGRRSSTLGCLGASSGPLAASPCPLPGCSTRVSSAPRIDLDMRNSLGWLRLGWLKIPYTTFR